MTSINYAPLAHLVAYVKNLDEQGFTLAAIAFVYMGIDAMAYLSLPSDQTRQTRQHFKHWVVEYMRAHEDQPYHYDADDMYAARCSVLHNYGSEADVHADNPNIKKYGYHDGGKHMYDPSVDPSLILIGSKSLINDFICGMCSFMDKIQQDESLKSCIEPRLSKLFSYFPANS